jgi:drug/metabolite transporter (DMT)-like permease
MSVVWGIPYLFIRIAVAEISPATLAFGRTAIAALLLLPVALLSVDLRPVLERWRWLLVFAAVEIGLPWVLIGSAEQRVSSSLTGLLVAGVPLVGTVFAAATRSRDRVGRAGLAGLLFGLAGVGAIVGFNVGAATWIAVVEIALVVIGYALGPVILARRLNGLSSLGVMALSLTVCTIAYAPFATVQWDRTVPSRQVLASVAVLGVVCTAIGFILFSKLIEEIGPVRATVITYVNPAVAALLGVLVLQETFTVAMGAGFVLVVAGSALATRPPPKREPVPALVPDVPISETGS